MKTSEDQLNFLFEDYASVNNFSQFVLMYMSENNVHYVAKKDAPELIPFINNDKIQVTINAGKADDLYHYNFKFRDIYVETKNNIIEATLDSLRKNNFNDLPIDIHIPLCLGTTIDDQKYGIQIWSTNEDIYVMEIF